MSESINKKIVSATKWSGVTELAAKLVAPISTMILARLLAPEAFGILVTAQLVITFAEVFTDAGFQKYLVQHEFASDEEKYQCTAVAFWSNLILSLTIWLGIAIFADPIARLVGCQGHGLMIIIASVCIPIEAFSSIQMALFKRALDFKTLFLVRMIGIAIPLVVTTPIAFFTRSYWSLIIGMIALNLSNALLLTIKSDWKPKWYYSFRQFKKMFSFTMWSMLEAVTIWLSSYGDIFIVGTLLSKYYLGIYRTSMATVGAIMGIITATTMPILFSALSRFQNSKSEFHELFFRFQKIIAILAFPLGMGIYLFSDLVTAILLGEQWGEASHFIGLWGISSAIIIVFSNLNSEVYRAKGYPKLSAFTQLFYLTTTLPAVWIAAHYSFDTLVITRTLSRIIGFVPIGCYLMSHVIKIPILKSFTNTIPVLVASSAMCLVLLLPEAAAWYTQVIYAVVAVVCYFDIILLFPKERNILLNLKTILKR